MCSMIWLKSYWIFSSIMNLKRKFNVFNQHCSNRNIASHNVQHSLEDFKICFKHLKINLIKYFSYLNFLQKWDMWKILRCVIRNRRKWYVENNMINNNLARLHGFRNRRLFMIPFSWRALMLTNFSNVNERNIKTVYGTYKARDT